MKILYYIMVSTFLYLVGLTFTLLRIYIDLGYMPKEVWVYSGVLLVLMLPIVSLFLYITDKLDNEINKKGVIR